MQGYELQNKPPKRWNGAAWPQLNVVKPRVSKPWKCVLQNGRDRKEKKQDFIKKRLPLLIYCIKVK